MSRPKITKELAEAFVKHLKEDFGDAKDVEDWPAFFREVADALEGKK